MQGFEIDFVKLSKDLQDIEIDRRERASRPIPLNPCRGLTGELNRKMIAGLAGHRSGNFSDEEWLEVQRLWADYDQKFPSIDSQ